MAVTINADNGVSSGSAGLKQTADSTGVLALQTNGTTAVTVDTSQNVGIGNTTVRNKLDVVGNTGIYSTGATSVGSPLGAQVYIGDSNYNTTSYYNAAPGFGAVYDATYASAAALAFYTYAGTPNARSERMRIDSSGNVGIGTSSFTHPFTVKKSNAGDWTCKFSNSSATGVSGFGYYDNSDTWKGYVGYDNGDANFLKLYATTSVGIKFITNTTEAMRIDSSGNLLVNTSTAQTGAKLAVTGGIQGTIQSGTAVNSTSGTSISFTSIPSWVKRITVQLNGVSTNGTSFLIIQLGTGATPTYTTTGYVSGSNSTTTTVGLLAHSGGSAVDVRLGSCVLTNFGNNIWNSSASGGFSNGAGTSTAGGYISLGATLTAVRITTINGTDTFDAGSINILYEG